MGIRAIIIDLRLPPRISFPIEIVVDAEVWDKANFVERQEIIKDHLNDVVTYEYKEL